MRARFLRFAGVKSRARGTSTVGLFLTLFALRRSCIGHSGAAAGLHP
ncbi:hypothetical protein ABIA43_006752 [Bradyrhizobium sp. USDA 328]